MPCPSAFDSWPFSMMRSWVLFFIAFMFVFLSSNYILQSDLTKLTSTTILKTVTIFNWQQPQQPPLHCVNGSLKTCPAHNPVKFKPRDTKSTKCPEYFRWIHEDLKPWEKTGITRDMVERGQNLSHFRLVIVNGRAYVEKYKKSFQTRDVFTIWGILQLLRLYPGMIPDLELMFQCGDKTVVEKSMYKQQEQGGPQEEEGELLSSPPPVFHYCGDENSLDIVFPDWTFWGWAELNIRPWEATLRSIQKGNKVVKWKNRKPYAFWKGNPMVSNIRKELGKCNVSDQQDWNARIYNIQWLDEKEKDSKNTKLENQCTHRYKIYIEGATWSVSEKYIIACDSMTMFIEPQYFDFFSRSMVPLKHYWPISSQNMCEEIKYAVDWGNTHQAKAQKIGKGGTKYITENLNMKFVYDYMFHLLRGYAKLMRFKPTIPQGAAEICPESMACRLMRHGGVRKDYMLESMVKSPSDTLPCTMPPPYKPQALQKLLHEKESLIQQVKARSMDNLQ